MKGHPIQAAQIMHMIVAAHHSCCSHHRCCTSSHKTSRLRPDCPALPLQSERVLFHYNGHGVPRPTANGEIWVFNKSYTQYIPMSIYDLQTWVGTPAIYLFDCSAAGLIVNSFKSFAEQRQQVIIVCPAGPCACRPCPYPESGSMLGG